MNRNRIKIDVVLTPEDKFQFTVSDEVVECRDVPEVLGHMCLAWLAHKDDDASVRVLGEVVPWLGLAELCEDVVKILAELTLVDEPLVVQLSDGRLVNPGDVTLCDLEMLVMNVMDVPDDIPANGHATTPPAYLC